MHRRPAVRSVDSGSQGSLLPKRESDGPRGQRDRERHRVRCFARTGGGARRLQRQSQGRLGLGGRERPRRISPPARAGAMVPVLPVRGYPGGFPSKGSGGISRGPRPSIRHEGGGAARAGGGRDERHVGGGGGFDSWSG